MQVVAGGNNTNTTVTGTTPDYQQVRNYYVGQGRYMDARDNETLARTVERINVQRNLELDKRAAEIRRRREADERRGW